MVLHCTLTSIQANMTPYEIITAIILLALIIVIGGVLYAVNSEDEEREDNEREKRNYLDEISNMKR